MDRDWKTLLEKSKYENENYYQTRIYFEDGDQKVVLIGRTEGIYVKKCIEKIKIIENMFKKCIEKLNIDMSVWSYKDATPEDYEMMMCGDAIDTIKIVKNKKAEYYKKDNTLRIWEDGLPVYENANGIITKDDKLEKIMEK